MALLLHTSVATYADEALKASIHFSPAENLEKIDVALLARARHSIDIAAYVLTDIPVIEALEAAARRGVKVRLYLDGGGRNPGTYVASALSRLAGAPSVEERYKTPGPFMHLKGYLVDHSYPPGRGELFRLRTQAPG